MKIYEDFKETFLEMNVFNRERQVIDSEIYLSTFLTPEEIKSAIRRSEKIKRSSEVKKLDENKVETTIGKLRRLRLEYMLYPDNTLELILELERIGAICHKTSYNYRKILKDYIEVEDSVKK